MKAISIGSAVALALLVMLGACGGSSDDGDGGTAATGEGRNAWGDCPSTVSDSEDGAEYTCTGEAAYDACIETECGAKIEACIGSGYATGNYGGPCGPTVRCVLACDCGDSGCELDCLTSATAECIACYDEVETCTNESGCPEPVCEADGGTGGTGAGGTGGEPGLGGSDPGTGGTGVGTGGGEPGGECPFESPSFDCDAACTNLQAIAAVCQSDDSVPDEIQVLLVAAAQGTGNLCRVTCAADSPSYPGQWGCFQAVPTSEPCTAIAGCTAANCD